LTQVPPYYNSMPGGWKTIPAHFLRLRHASPPKKRAVKFVLRWPNGFRCALARFWIVNTKIDKSRSKFSCRFVPLRLAYRLTIYIRPVQASQTLPFRYFSLRSLQPGLYVSAQWSHNQWQTDRQMQDPGGCR